jgi:hypothetical protein
MRRDVTRMSRALPVGVEAAFPMSRSDSGRAPAFHEMFVLAKSQEIAEQVGVSSDDRSRWTSDRAIAPRSAQRVAETFSMPWHRRQRKSTR